jgi:ribosomal protein S20
MSKAIKDFRESNKRTNARTQLNQVMGLIDKAAKQHIVHKNKAARDKARLMTFFNRLPE